MSDVSEGPGWWVASDGKWYRPEQHPDYKPPAPPPPPPPPPAPPPTAPIAQPSGVWAAPTAQMPTAPPTAPPATPPGWYRDPSNPAASRYWDGTAWGSETHALGSPTATLPTTPVSGPTSLPPTTSLPGKRMTNIRWVNIGALIAGAVGLILPWVTVSIASANGLDTNGGKEYGVFVVIAALLLWWHIVRTNALARVLLFLAWVGVLAGAVYDVVEVTTIHNNASGISVGSGLYLSTAAGAVGLITAVMDMTGVGQQSREVGTTPSPVWMPWAAGAVGILALVGAGIAGHNATSGLLTPSSNTGNVNTGNNTGAGNTGSGNTGSGNTGSTATTTTAGNTGAGSTGNTGTTTTAGTGGTGTGGTGTGNT